MSICKKITDWYITLMLLIFPLFTGFSGYSCITNSKFYFFAIATLLWLLGLLVFGLRGRAHMGRLSWKDPLVILFLVYIGLSCLSSLCSPWLPDTLLGAGRWDGLASLLLYAAVFLGVRSFGAPKRKYLYALALSTLLCSIVAIGQLLGRNPLGLFPGTLGYFDAHIHYSGEFLGTIGNVDVLAAFLCLCVPAFIGAFILDAKEAPLLFSAALGMFLLLCADVKSGFVGLACAILFSTALLLRSRAAVQRALLSAAVLLSACFAASLLRFTADGPVWAFSARTKLCLAGTLFFLLWMGVLWLRRKRPEPNKGVYPRVFLLLAGGGLLAALLYVYFYPGDTGTLYELSRVLHGELREEFGSSRIRIWRDVLKLIGQRPLLGGGCGSIGNRLDILFSREVPETGRALQSYVDNAHNIYLTVLADAGIPAFLSFLGALALGFLRWCRKLPHAPLAGALGCGLIAYLGEEFFGLGLCLVAPLFWILWGLVEAKSGSRPDAPAGSSAPAGSK